MTILSSYIRSLHEHVLNTVIPIIITTAFILLVAARFGFAEHTIFYLHATRPIYYLLLAVALLPPSAAAAVTVFFLVNRRSRRSVYLVDYSCFKPISDCRIPMAMFREYMAHFMRSSMTAASNSSRVCSTTLALARKPACPLPTSAYLRASDSAMPVLRPS